MTVTTAWLLVYIVVGAGGIEGIRPVINFMDKTACLQARLMLAQNPMINIRHTKCVEISIGEPV